MRRISFLVSIHRYNSFRQRTGPNSLKDSFYPDGLPFSSLSTGHDAAELLLQGTRAAGGRSINQTWAASSRLTHTGCGETV